jgi:hypothetical protein
MVKSSSGKDGLRSFRVVEVSKHGGCRTKFNAGSRYINKDPVQAAQKAFTEACRIKNIRGQCTLIVTVQDTTRGVRTEGKMYSYRMKRVKDPVIRFEGTENEFVNEYRVVPKSIEVPIACQTPGQTRGRKKKRTAKKSRMNGNNVRKAQQKKSNKKNN